MGGAGSGRSWLFGVSRSSLAVSTVRGPGLQRIQLQARVCRLARESAPREHGDVLGSAGGLQFTIGGLVAVVDSVGSCRWGAAELIEEAVLEPVVVSDSYASAGR
jgi:hypothetical protein